MLRTLLDGNFYKARKSLLYHHLWVVSASLTYFYFQCRPKYDLYNSRIIKVGAKVMATIFFFDDTSPVEKCDTYRRKDKVLPTCVDMNRTDIS